MSDVLVGAAITNFGTINEQYDRSHNANDFSAFIASIYSVGGFDEQFCKKFINYPILLPAPSLGVFRVDIFLKHMEVLKTVELLSI